MEGDENRKKLKRKRRRSSRSASPRKRIAEDLIAEKKSKRARTTALEGTVQSTPSSPSLAEYAAGGSERGGDDGGEGRKRKRQRKRMRTRRRRGKDNVNTADQSPSKNDHTLSALACEGIPKQLLSARETQVSSSSSAKALQPVGDLKKAKPRKK